MSVTLEPLIADFIAWLAAGPRPYAEALEVWRTSCPRLTVWEDAAERGLVATRRTAGREMLLEPTDAGRAFLARRR
ncbi:MAG: hypothetical protein IT555_19705 [Acetobacteraceae bacterium]|nr:hypothetical protein [Acetobacteraceae bacterium]